MSAELILAGLVPAFRAKVQQMIADCAAVNVIVVPYFGIRTVQEQAKLWRQSRGPEDVQHAVDTLTTAGASYLAGVLLEVGPQPTGPWATNALPGESWHEFGEACDLYVMGADGKPAWAAENPGYEVMAQKAEALGLTSGKRWSHPDTDHVQLRQASSPLTSMGLRFIDVAMAGLAKQPMTAV